VFTCQIVSFVSHHCSPLLTVRCGWTWCYMNVLDQTVNRVQRYKEHT